MEEFEVTQKQATSPDGSSGMLQRVKGYKYGVTLEQTITVCGRNEILQLTKIPTVNLIEELQARGVFAEIGKDYYLEQQLCLVLKSHEGEYKLLDKINNAIISASLILSDNIQKNAAKLLGITPRVFHYKYHNIINNTLSSDPTPTKLIEGTTE